MRNFLVFSVLFCLTACQEPSSKFKKFDFDYFTAILPSDTKEKSLNSIDSYAARLESQYGEFFFDYGLYSPKLTLSPGEYLEEREWEMQDEFLLFPVLEPTGTFVDLENLGNGQYKSHYDISECLKSQDCILNPKSEKFDSSFYETFTEYFSINDSLLSYQFSIPNKLNEYEFFITESDSIFKRVFIPYNIDTHKAGVYILNKNSCSDRYNCTDQLSFWTSDSTSLTRKGLIKVLKSVKLK